MVTASSTSQMAVNLRQSGNMGELLVPEAVEDNTHSKMGSSIRRVGGATVTALPTGGSILRCVMGSDQQVRVMNIATATTRPFSQAVLYVITSTPGETDTVH